VEIIIAALMLPRKYAAAIERIAASIIKSQNQIDSAVSESFSVMMPKSPFSIILTSISRALSKVDFC
jgi:cellobiose-specific phosphotransferase system component IIC